MLIIPSGKHLIYHDFELDIPEELHFLAEHRYLLKGVNGSGKTTFLQQVLLPALHNQPERQYILYLEQQMRGQLLAVKAHAAIHGYKHHLSSESDAVEYLLHDLRLSMQNQIRHTFLIIDESTAAQPFRDYWAANRNTACLLEVTHDDHTDRDGWNILHCNMENPSLTRVTAR